MRQCIIPPAIFGPIISANPYLLINSSNQLINSLIKGAGKRARPKTKDRFFVDVRDVALGYVLAAEKQEAAGKHILLVADKFCWKQVVGIIRDEFPNLNDILLSARAFKPDVFSAFRMLDVDNRRSVQVLGMTYRSLTESVVDSVKSIQPCGPIQRLGSFNTFQRVPRVDE